MANKIICLFSLSSYFNNKFIYSKIWFISIIYFISYGFFNYHYPEEPKGFLPGLKIGYTSNWETRKLYYQRDLLDYEFLSSRPGDEVLEQAIHIWYSDYRLRVRRLTEWFRDYDYIRDTFDIIPDDVFLRYSENLYRQAEMFASIAMQYGYKYTLAKLNEGLED